MQINLGKRTISFAKRPAPKIESEQGSVGDQQVTSLFDGETINTGDIKIADLRQMRKNDGTARALYSVLTMPILSSEWDITPADDSAEAKAQAEFVKDCFSLPPYNGGMSTPFDLVLADMLRATLEGWRAFEKVHTLRNGKIVYGKIARRENSSVTVRTDGRGGFDGFSQYAYIDGTYKRVIIKKEKAFVYTFGKEWDNFYGESAFLAGYYHYDKKHRLYYGAHQAVQYGAIPPKIVKGKPNASQTDLDNVVDAVDQLGFNSTVGIPDGYEASPYEASKGRIDPVPLIEHHDAAMARSILAQFMMLGVGENSSGSWALSSDQSDFFILALESVMRSIEQHINTFLIAELHEFNFETPLYSKFKFNNLSDNTIALLKEVALKIFDKRPERIPDALIGEVIQKIATQLGVDIPKDKLDASDNTATESTNQDTTSSQSRSHKHFLANGAKWHRELTPAESKVNFTAISKKMTTLETDFQQSVKPVFDKLRADTVKRLDKILAVGDTKALDGFTLNYGKEYTNIIAGNMLDAYTYAKVGAADELNVGAPATKAASKQLIKQQASSISDKQLGDMAFNVKNIVQEAIRKNQLAKTNLSIGDVLASVGTMISAFYDDKVLPTASVVIAKGINIGRNDVFETNKNNISRYQYSAILDEVTCPICEDLDGTVVDEAEYRSTQWMPPIHFSCRCIWVAIMSDETEQPDITGIPDAPGNATDPLLSRETSDELDTKTQEAIAELAVTKVLDRMLDEAGKDGSE